MIFIEGKIYPVSRDLVAIPSKEYECILSREEIERLMKCVDNLNINISPVDIRISNPHKDEIKIVTIKGD